VRPRTVPRKGRWHSADRRPSSKLPGRHNSQISDLWDLTTQLGLSGIPTGVSPKGPMRPRGVHVVLFGPHRTGGAFHRPWKGARAGIVSRLWNSVSGLPLARPSSRLGPPLGPRGTFYPGPRRDGQRTGPRRGRRGATWDRPEATVDLADRHGPSRTARIVRNRVGPVSTSPPGPRRSCRRTAVVLTGARAFLARVEGPQRDSGRGRLGRL